MKIHTTQDLNSLVRKPEQPTNTGTNPSEIRTSLERRKLLFKESAIYEDNITFQAGSSGSARDILPNLAKRIKDTTSKRASDKKGIMERVLSSARFNRILQSINDNEVITSASTAFLIGWACRVPTILTLPEWLGGKHKEDKAMAAAHSGASVTMSLLTAIILTLPVNKAASHVREKLYHKIKPELLKKRHPQLDLNSIKDSTGKILEKSFWKNIDGKIFDSNVKTPMSVARPKYCGDIAESTYKSMGIDIDMAANAGKSVQDMVLRDGRKLVDVLTVKDMFIAVEEKGMGTTLKGLKDTNFFSLEYIDKEFLAKTMPELDMNTAFVKDKITHPTQWKTKAGKPAFDFDVYLSNYLETAESTPIYTGAKRLDGNVQKYVAYQNNGNGGLGTAITNEMIKADGQVDITNKIIGWAVEVTTRIPVGLFTVAMIPKILNVFKSIENINKDNKKGLKSSNVTEKNLAKEEVKNDKTLDVAENKAGSVSFKGKNPNKVTQWLAENYVLKILNSTKLSQFVDNFSKNVNMSMTEIMTILGSFLMSGSYVVGTLTNKKFKDKDRRNTLAINQALGFVVPTALGTWISSKIRPKVKTATYKFVGEQSQRIKLLAQNGKITKDAEEKALKGIAKASKGMPVFASLTIFTFIYRYFTPVAVTPVANWFGNKLAERKAAKANLK